MKDIEIAVVVISVISCLFSLAVIGTILFFRKMQRGKFMPIILYMSMADFGLNLTSSFGFPTENNTLCWFQGVFATYFTICGWFWTTALAYRVYCMVRYGGCKLTLPQAHLICWGLPAFLTALPLTTTNYGTQEGTDEWCLFVQRKGIPRWWQEFWSITTFFVWLFLCVGAMITWQTIIYFQFQNSSMKEVIRRTYDKLYLYPIVMVACWVLNVMCSNFAEGHGNLNAISMIAAICNGIISAIIFMSKSEEAQRRWYRYFFPPVSHTFDEIAEPRLDFEFDDDEVIDMTDYGRGTTCSINSKMSEFDSRGSSVGNVSSSISNPMVEL